MTQAENLFSFVQSIRSPAMVTNAFFTPISLMELQSCKELRIIIGEKAAIIYYPDEGNVIRIFFYAVNTREALKEVYTLLPMAIQGQTYVCDVIGKEKSLINLRHAMEQAGFRFYARFQRMVCKKFPVLSQWDLSQVELAKKQDMKVIHKLLYNTFDPITSHLPSETKVLQMIEHGEVFVIRNGQEIAGFTSFDSADKQVAYLSYVVTLPQYRKQYIARKLFLAKVLLHNGICKYYYLWVDISSNAAIQSHEKNGFVKDEIYDDIYII